MHVDYASNAPPTLDARPEARAFVVDNLIRHLLTGSLRVPRFQRGLKWADEDRIKFLDSLYRGYPVGTLLLWKKRADAERIVWGRRTIEAPARSDALWVVDGQQRLTTLAEAAFAEHNLNSRPICFDFEEAEFRYPRVRGEQKPEKLVPAAVLLDSKALITWLKNARPEHVDLALDAGKRLREYEIPAYVIETEDESLLRKVFERTNRSGKALEAREVFDALHGALSREHPGTITALATGLKDLGFGAIDPNTLYRALCGVEGLPIDRADRVPPGFNAGPALGHTDDAVRRVIAFLRTECAIPHASLLPYELPLIVLTKLFHYFPALPQRYLTLLRRWLWRGAVNEQFTGATVGLRQHLQAVDASSEASSIQNLLKLAGRKPKPYPRLAEDFNLNTARAKLASCALAGLQPKHLLSNETIDIAAMLDNEQNALKEPVLSHRRGSSPVWRHLANRMFHPRGSDTLARLISSAELPSLHSHGITEEAQKHLIEGNREKFLERRAAFLDKWVDSFSKARAEWDADDTPALDDLLVDD